MQELSRNLDGRSVLVTGGAGFIGSHTVDRLLQLGANVTVLDNFSAGRRERVSAREIRVVEGDIRNLSDVRNAMSGVEAVVHLAAQVSVRASVVDPLNSEAHNVSGFVTILQAAREEGVKRVVYASSAAVYGSPDALPLDERSPTRPLSPYGLEKLIDEQYARLFSDLYGLSCLGLRYFNVYGPRQDPRSSYAGVISRFVDKARRGEPVTIYGDGQQTRDFVYVADVARVNVEALADDRPGVVAIGTGASVSLLQLAETLGYCIGDRIKVDFESAVEGDIRHSALNPAELRQWLGWAPGTPLQEGLQRLLASEPEGTVNT